MSDDTKALADRNGWTLPFSYLQEVQRKAAFEIGVGEDEAAPSLETVEAVCLADRALRASSGEPEHGEEQSDTCNYLMPQPPPVRYGQPRAAHCGMNGLNGHAFQPAAEVTR